ncbi:Transcriptional regulator, LysR family [hydrothermal vent metagenome]|uniref:Transcriptional regulator, LysR family n=1 Tax=hydrothermal vent metagenome TaxID=652676 RepID=A0A3B1B2T9_9ZZZZ
MDIASRLILFADVIDCGSFSKAAQRRDVNRSLISKQIAKLEEHFELRLLNRTTRSLSLTDAGRAIYQHASALRDQLRETGALAESLREDISGELRISSTSHFGRLHVLPVLTSLAEDYPALTIDLRLEDRYVDLVGERFDVAIRITEPDDSSLIARKLADNPFFMVASPAYLKKKGRPETVADLAEHRFIIYAGDNVTVNSWAYYDDLEVKTFAINGYLKVNDGDGLLKAAQAGMGLAMLPTFLICDAIKNKSLVRVLPDLKLKPYSPIYIMYPSRSHIPKKIRLFIDRMLDYIEQDECIKS